MSASVQQQLGRRVAVLRRAAGLTQAELAERVRVTTETVSRLERGRTLPSVPRMSEIASALGVGLHELFLFADRPTRKDRAVARLLAIVRRRHAEDVEVIADIAARIFAR